MALFGPTKPLGEKVFPRKEWRESVAKATLILKGFIREAEASRSLRAPKCRVFHEAVKSCPVTEHAAIDGFVVSQVPKCEGPGAPNLNF